MTDTFEIALRDLVNQIMKTNPVDDHGHDLRMNMAYLKAIDVLDASASRNVGGKNFRAMQEPTPYGYVHLEIGAGGDVVKFLDAPISGKEHCAVAVYKAHDLWSAYDAGDANAVGMNAELREHMQKLCDEIDHAKGQIETLDVSNHALRRESYDWSRACEEATKKLEPYRLALWPFAAHPAFQAPDEWPVTIIDQESRKPGVTVGDFRRAHALIMNFGEFE